MFVLFIIKTASLCLIAILIVNSNPGYINNHEKVTLQLMVEKNISFEEFCSYCLVHKTTSSKHCLICERCVDMFDHHCFWINNCVGRKNIRIFGLFLFLVSLELLFVLSAGLTSDIVISFGKVQLVQVLQHYTRTFIWGMVLFSWNCVDYLIA